MSDKRYAPNKIQIPPKEDVEYQYHTLNKSTTQVGEYFGVSNVTAERWLRYHNIPIKNRKLQAPPKEVLESEYQEYGCTISKLARKYNTSNPTVRKWLKEYGIQTKGHKVSTQEHNDLKSNNIPPKEELQKLYDDFQSVIELAKYLRVNVERLKQVFQKYGIQQLSLSEATSIGKQKSWNRRKPPKEDVISVYKKYKNLGATANHFSMSINSLRKIFQEYGIKVQYGQRSQKEIELFEWCQSLNPELDWVANERSLIAPFEVDMYCPELNLAIEYNGVYWHSQSGPNNIDKNYHQKKWKMCNEQGVKLITVFETDDIEKVKNLIRHIIKPTNRVYARLCTVERVTSSEAKSFHEQYHINGFVGGSYHYALKYKGEIVQVASFSKTRFNKDYDFECARNTIGDTSVIGGTSKLFKSFFREVGDVSLLSYADLRFGSGDVYKHCGLTLKYVTKPNYYYYNKNNPDGLESRVKFQKHKLEYLLSDYDPNQTEYQNMIHNGYDRVFDCGNAVWVSPKYI